MAYTVCVMDCRCSLNQGRCCLLQLVAQVIRRNDSGVWIALEGDYHCVNSVHVYVYVCGRVYVCMFVCAYAFVYLCVYVYMCVCVHMHVGTHVHVFACVSMFV